MLDHIDTNEKWIGFYYNLDRVWGLYLYGQLVAIGSNDTIRELYERIVQ